MLSFEFCHINEVIKNQREFVRERDNNRKTCIELRQK